MKRANSKSEPSKSTPKPISESKTVHKSQESDSFGIFDILRIIAGLIVLNAFFSWWFTSTGTWGYNGRWADVRYLKHRFIDGDLNLTLADLAKYDGSNKYSPIYIAINGSVYDVTNGRAIYGPGGTYSVFSGKDAARVFITGCFQKKDEYTYDLRGLDFTEAKKELDSWKSYYENSRKYWFVGYVNHEPIVGDPPSACQEMKYPGMRTNHRMVS